MPTTTSRLALQNPVIADAPSAIRIAITANNATLDSAVEYASGTAAGLSTSFAGRLLRATDTQQWLLDNGSSLDRLVTAGTFLAARSTSANITANPGDLVVVTSGNPTITLPAVAANATVGVFVLNGAVSGASPVTVAGVKIYGVGLSNASSLLLGTPGAFVVLQSDGTNWLVIAGQQDTGWVPLTLTTNWIAVAGNYTPAARVQGSMVDLCGIIKNNTGSYYSGATAIATLPSVAFPSGNVVAAIGTGDNGVNSCSCNINTTGTIWPNVAATPLANTHTFSVDNVRYRLT